MSTEATDEVSLPDWAKLEYGKIYETLSIILLLISITSFCCWGYFCFTLFGQKKVKAWSEKWRIVQ